MTEQGKGILRRAICLLREIEWEAYNGYNDADAACPACGGFRSPDGHMLDCELDAVRGDLESLLGLPEEPAPLVDPALDGAD